MNHGQNQSIDLYLLSNHIIPVSYMFNVHQRTSSMTTSTCYLPPNFFHWICFTVNVLPT